MSNKKEIKVDKEALKASKADKTKAIKGNKIVKK